MTTPKWTLPLAGLILLACPQAEYEQMQVDSSKLNSLTLVEPRMIVPPGPPPYECNTGHLPESIRDEARDCVREILDNVAILAARGGWDPTEEVEKMCARIQLGIDELVAHSAEGIPDQDIMLEWVKLKFRLSNELFVVSDSSRRRDGVPTRLARDSKDRPPPRGPAGVDEGPLPCGASGELMTVCATDEPLPDGDYIILAAATQGAIPTTDGALHHQFGFVFDADGDPDNNYVADPAFPNDFFRGTDLWYALTYSPDAGWSLDVSTAHGSTITPIASRARVVVGPQWVMALVPVGELQTACPEYRMTSFTHSGDYGLMPPHFWGGDTEPTVESPLLSVCG